MGYSTNAVVQSNIQLADDGGNLGTYLKISHPNTDPDIPENTFQVGDVLRVDAGIYSGREYTITGIHSQSQYTQYFTFQPYVQINPANVAFSRISSSSFNDKVYFSDTIHLAGQLQTHVTEGNTFTNNTWNFDCDAGMMQHVDGEGMTGTGTITFSNWKLGNTYVILFEQGSGNHNITLPDGWWLNDTVFDFTTLGDNGRALITMTPFYYSYHFSVKDLLQNVNP